MPEFGQRGGLSFLVHLVLCFVGWVWAEDDQGRPPDDFRLFGKGIPESLQTTLWIFRSQVARAHEKDVGRLRAHTDVTLRIEQLLNDLIER